MINNFDLTSFTQPIDNVASKFLPGPVLPYRLTLGGLAVGAVLRNALAGAAIGFAADQFLPYGSEGAYTPPEGGEPGGDEDDGYVPVPVDPDPDPGETDELSVALSGMQSGRWRIAGLGETSVSISIQDDLLIISSPWRRPDGRAITWEDVKDPSVGFRYTSPQSLNTINSILLSSLGKQLDVVLDDIQAAFPLAHLGIDGLLLPEYVMYDRDRIVSGSYNAGISGSPGVNISGIHLYHKVTESAVDSSGFDGYYDWVRYRVSGTSVRSRLIPTSEADLTNKFDQAAGSMVSKRDVIESILRGEIVLSPKRSIPGAAYDATWDYSKLLPPSSTLLRYIDEIAFRNDVIHDTESRETWTSYYMTRTARYPDTEIK